MVTGRIYHTSISSCVLFPEPKVTLKTVEVCLSANSIAEKVAKQSIGSEVASVISNLGLNNDNLSCYDIELTEKQQTDKHSGVSNPDTVTPVQNKCDESWIRHLTFSGLNLLVTYYYYDSNSTSMTIRPCTVHFRPEFRKLNPAVFLRIKEVIPSMTHYQNYQEYKISCFDVLLHY